MSDSLGNRINRLILALDMTKTAFAEKLKVSQPYISKLIADHGNPGDRLMDDICEKSGVNRDWLINGGPDENMFKVDFKIDELSDYCAEITKREDN